MAEECAENIEETGLVEIHLTESKHNSCTLHIVLFSLIFTVNIRIGSYFLYFHWYLKGDDVCVKFGTCTQTAM